MCIEIVCIKVCINEQKYWFIVKVVTTINNIRAFRCHFQIYSIGWRMSWSNWSSRKTKFHNRHEWMKSIIVFWKEEYRWVKQSSLLGLMLKILSDKPSPKMELLGPIGPIWGNFSIPTQLAKSSRVLCVQRVTVSLRYRNGVSG